MSDSPKSRSPLSAQQLLTVTETLNRVVEDRSLLLHLTREQQMLFLRAAEQVAHPDRSAKRQMLRALRTEHRKKRDERKQRDQALLDRTGIRQLTPVCRLDQLLPTAVASSSSAPEPSANRDDSEMTVAVGRLQVPRNCYICKSAFEEVHFFYDSLCPDCAAFNWLKRQQTADLSGRFALLTGGRVKIGFEAGLKLLRAGASVVVTTRFPRDAAKRYAAQVDSHLWLERLQIYGLDLRHTPSVEAFAEHLLRTAPRLDFILSNACQTIRRPAGFYEHLLVEERESLVELPASIQQLLGGYEQFLAGEPSSGSEPSPETLGPLMPPGNNSAELIAGQGRDRSMLPAHEWSQVALLPDDETCREDVFPTGRLDQDLQQLDLRGVNSWRLKLADVSTVEMLEVQLVNAIAPFILNARLKPLMLRHPTGDKHIVNVSAMEGVFYRALKRDTHPHTNMAKAALNMMTRTSAADYIKAGIHMNSVDTGWITDEDPLDITQRKQHEHGFRTPLDAVDAAARICDPIFAGLNSGEHVWGKFLKDYRVSSW